MVSADNAANDSTKLTCTLCGCCSTWREAFIEVKDGTLKRLCCPVCAQRQRSKWGRWFVVSMPVALALAIYMYSHRPRDPVVVALLAFWVFTFSQYPLVLLHELGHVIAAWLVRAPAYAIVIGNEPWLFDRTVGALRWRIGYRILGGLTFHAPCEGPNASRNSILITAAGPFVNLVIAAAALGVASTMPGRWTDSFGKFALVVVGVSSAAQFVRNAWPRSIKTAVGKIANDAARIVALWRGSDDDPRAARTGQRYMLASFAYADRDFASAERAALLAQEECDRPETMAAIRVLRGAALAESDKVDEAITVLQSLQERPIRNPGIRASADDNLAWAYFLVDVPTALERALPLIESARAVAPWETSFAITHACLLAASAVPGDGRAQSAHALLAGIRASNPNRQVRAYTALARGLIAAANGDAAAARSEYANARSRGATAAPLRVLERRLASV